MGDSSIVGLTSMRSGTGIYLGLGGPTNSVSPLIMCIPLNLAARTRSGDLEDSFASVLPAITALSKSSLLRSCGENRRGIAKPLGKFGPILEEPCLSRIHGDLSPYTLEF